jgi:hypothetical protein
MADSFDSELNAYNSAYDARAEREEELADLITDLYIGSEYADLYQNGKYRGWLSLDEAITRALEDDDNDEWTINDEEE